MDTAPYIKKTIEVQFIAVEIKGAKESKCLHG